MPQLRIKTGPQKGKTIQIDGSTPVILGRDPKTTFQIIDKGVSREHSEVFRVGEMVFIRDLESRNGTFVNEEQLEEELLREGDVIRIGSTQICFESTKKHAREADDLEYDDSIFKSSLELKVGDLFVDENINTHREGELFRAICQAQEIFNEETEPQRIFDRLLELIQESIPADHVYLFVRDEKTGAITPRASRQQSSGSSVPISRTILKRVIAEARAILTADAMQDERFNMGDSIVLNQIRSVLCVPIHLGQQTYGAVYAVNASIAETFEQHDLELLAALGSQLAMILENLERSEARRQLFHKLIASLLCGLDRDGSAAAHAERVSRFAVAIGQELNCKGEPLFQLGLTGLLHDLGRHRLQVQQAMTASDREGLEASEGRLTERERWALETESALKHIPELESVLPALRAQYERYDGTGFPDRLKGSAIPLAARILAVANAFAESIEKEAADKPESLNDPDPSLIRKALTEIGNQGGESFDLEVVRALMVAYRHGRLFPSPKAAPSISSRRTAPQAMT